MSALRPCYGCGGSGRRGVFECGRCGGTGRAPEPAAAHVDRRGDLRLPGPNRSGRLKRPRRSESGVGAGLHPRSRCHEPTRRTGRLIVDACRPGREPLRRLVGEFGHGPEALVTFDV